MCWGVSDHLSDDDDLSSGLIDDCGMQPRWPALDTVSDGPDGSAESTGLEARVGCLRRCNPVED